MERQHAIALMFWFQRAYPLVPVSSMQEADAIRPGIALIEAVAQGKTELQVKPPPDTKTETEPKTQPAN